jgi:hypothetical protein
MHISRPTAGSAALVVASLALLVAAAQPGYAALSALGKNSVGSQEIKDGSVRDDDLAKNSVNSATIKNGAVKRQDLADDSVGSGQLASGSVLGSDLAAGSVDYSKIADGTVGRAELSANAVDSPKIVDGSVSLSDLAASARPAKIAAGGWSRYPTGWTPVTSLASVGSLAVDGGGALTVTQPSLLVVSGQIRVRSNISVLGGVLDCTVLVNGVALAATANVGLAGLTSTTVPIVAGSTLPAGSYDVGVSCTGANVSVQLVRVNVMAFAT